MTKDITSEQRAVCFRLLDEYARTKHTCFVTEFFLSTQSDEYVVCFRPLGLAKDSANRYARKYLRLGIKDIQTISSAQSLPVATSELLDEALPMLPHDE